MPRLRGDSLILRQVLPVSRLSFVFRAPLAGLLVLSVLAGCAADPKAATTAPLKGVPPEYQARPDGERVVPAVNPAYLNERNRRRWVEYTGPEGKDTIVIDPYAREWQNGCGRWDLLDVVRAARALRPDGIEWPTHEDGRASFKLEHLTAANGLAHEAAHDALSDVRATVALARLIRNKQPPIDITIVQRKSVHEDFSSPLSTVADDHPQVSSFKELLSSSDSRTVGLKPSASTLRSLNVSCRYLSCCG